jgi:hypothetical protein
MIQYITFNSTARKGPDGIVGINQRQWLEGVLKGFSSRYLDVTGAIVNQPTVQDKLIVLFCHHTIATIVDGEDLKKILLRFPNVILLVNGHTHANVITPHPRADTSAIAGGFWEVNTASHIDWPVQSRLIEIGVGKGPGERRTVSIFTTVVDIDAPLVPTAAGADPANLASWGRYLALNDPTERPRKRSGDPQDRNTQLLVPAPFRIPPYLAARRTTPITAVARTADRIDVFAVAKDGRTMTNWQDTAHGWAGWSHISGGHASAFGAGSPITAVHRVAQTVEVFTLGGDNHVWRAFSSGSSAWSTWTEVPGGLLCWPGSTVTAVARDSNHLDLFAIGADGRVMTTWWNSTGGYPNSWFVVGGDGPTVALGSTVTAIARNPNHIDVFMVGNGDNRPRVASWDAATGWTGWLTLGTTHLRSDAAITTLARDSNHVDLFSTDLSGRIVTTWWNNSVGWAPEWIFVDSQFVAAGSTVTAIARSSTHIDLFAVGKDNQVRSVYWDAATNWTHWFNVGTLADVNSHVGVVSRLADHIDLFIVSGDPVATPSFVMNQPWTQTTDWGVAAAIASTA